MNFSLAINTDLLVDYSIGEDGRLVLTVDADTIVDRLRVRLKTWLGDWYLDTERGIGYKNRILGKSIGGSEISAIIRREILLESGVQRINSFAIFQDSANPRGFLINADITIEGADGTVTVTL